MAQNPPIDELVAQNAHYSRERPENVKKTLFQPKHYAFGDSLFESSSDSGRARPDPQEIDLDDDEVLLRAKISSQRAKDFTEQSQQVSDNLKRQLEETERLLKELTEKDAGKGGSGGIAKNAPKNESHTNSGEPEAVSPGGNAKVNIPLLPNNAEENREMDEKIRRDLQLKL